MAVLVAANAFFVIAEYALVTARRSALQQRANEGSRRARRALAIMEDPVRVLSTVQVCITAVGVLLGAVGEPALRPLFEPVLAAGISVALSLGIVTFLSVWLGELVPKALALHSAESVALLVARPIDLLGRALAPVVRLLQLAAAAVLRPLGIPSVSAGDRPVSREELRSVLEEAEEHGTLRPEEEQMLTSVIDLRQDQVRDVLVPWDDVVALRADDTVAHAADVVLASRHSRYPALEDDGGVAGVVHLRDLWQAVTRDPSGPVREVLRVPVVVPPGALLPDVMRRLRQAGQHMAIVMNEYGQMLGVATLEDIVEQVMGEIEDEHDRPNRLVRRLDTGAWAIDAGTAIPEVNRLAGLDLPDERDHTVGGLVFSELGRAPRPGDEVHVGGVALRVDAVDGHRIERVVARIA